MQRRSFIALSAQWSSLDLWHMQVEQMRNDDITAEMDKRNKAATRVREIREALSALIRAINEDGKTLCSAHERNVKAEKRFKDVLKRALNSLKD